MLLPDRPATGAALFLAGLAAAAGMDALVKLSADGRSLGELMLWRGFGALPFLAVFAALGGGGGLAGLVPRSPVFVLARGAVVALGTALFFWSLRGLTLPVAYVVAFTAPLVLTVLAAATGTERVGRRSWLAVAVGFAGVLVAAAPGGRDLAGTTALPALAALAATFLYALGLFLVRHAGGASEEAGALVLGNLLAAGVLGGVLALAGGQMPAPHATADLARLSGVAALAGASQILVTVAFAAAPASRLAACEYETLPLGAVFGYLLWGDVPSAGVAAGAFLVGAAVWLAASGTGPGSSVA